MDRRLVGALLVVVVISAAIVLPPLLAGSRVAGSASAIDLPDPPRVGSCLLYSLPAAGDDLTDGTSVDLAGYRAGQRAHDGDVLPAIAVFGPCDGEIAGEVVDVIEAPGDAATRRATAIGAEQQCRAATSDYTGLDDATARFTDSPDATAPDATAPDATAPDATADPVRWSPSVNLRYRWVQPEPLQRAAGRTWLACVVTPSRPVLYSGSVAAAFSTGTLPNPFGLCWAGATVRVGMGVVDCSLPHSSELLSVGRVEEPTRWTSSQVRAACARVATAFIGRSDPTAGGALDIPVTPPDLDRRVFWDAPLDLTCYLTASGGRQLDGTVVSLGDRPIPFVS